MKLDPYKYVYALGCHKSGSSCDDRPTPLGLIGDLFSRSMRLAKHHRATPSLQQTYARRELLIHENEP
jgi:hypothetical protein